MAVAVGISFHADADYLDLVMPLAARAADYVEVAPETLWRAAPDGELVANAYWNRLAEFVDATGKDVVAHGVGLSLGTADPADAPRLQRWLHRIAADHRRFRFRWYTDHLGATVLAGHELGLPLPLPMTAAAAAVVRGRLAALQTVVADVGFENSVFYFLLGGWLDEPAFFATILDAPGRHLLLDLHNVHTMARNLGADAGEYLRRLDLGRVIEIHLSGGSDSDPGWLASGRSLRLDSHDSTVPEAVWELLAAVAPRCPNLRGVTLERMEGTVGAGDVDGLAAELARIREVVGGGR